ncbi:MAG: carboxypeptidase regulatory-like domain-containing protein [Gemmatimonadota bacterium]
MKHLRLGCLLIVPLCVAPLVLSAQAAVIVGTVRDKDGAGVLGAEVLVEGGALQARTDNLGRYRIAGVPAVPSRIVVRRLGYRLEAVNVVVVESRDNVVDIRVDAVPQSVDAVTIVGRAAPRDYRMEGFYERARLKSGGYFITRSQIASRNAVDALQIIRGAPSLRIGNNSRLGRTVRLRNSNCSPLVFIDGFPLTAGAFDFESLSAEAIEGIEIYSGVSSIPPELQGPRGGSLCGVIAIWGRQFLPSTRSVRAPKLTEATLAASRVRALVAANIAYATDGVDTQALLDGKSFAPQYPETLIEERATGKVRVEFVVDSVGAILWNTYSVVATTDVRCNGAVRDALLRSRFTPAVRAGRHVAQVVQVPVNFLPPASPNGRGASQAGAATPPVADRWD